MIPLTINAPIPFGYHRDGTIAQAEMRRRCAVVVGETNSGKSVVLHNLTAGLIRCPDVLVWHIDIGGAGLALPWIEPWLEHEMSSPVIDWVAPDEDEALTMTRYALDIIRSRRINYRRLMRNANTDILPVTHGLPTIHIVMDESAEVTGDGAHPELISNVTRIIKLGRFVGVRMALSGLRATATEIPTNAFKQIGLRIGMKVADEAEAGYLFGWRYRPDPQDTPYAGCGLWRDGQDGTVLPFRSYNLSQPEEIVRIAKACEHWRPILDEPSRLGRGEAAYLSRWDRTVPLLTGETSSGTPRETVTGTRGGTDVAAPSRPVAAGGIGNLAAVDAAISRGKAQLAAERLATMPQEYVDRQAAALEAQFTSEPHTPEPPAELVTEAEARMLELLIKAGSEGTSGHKLVQQLAADGFKASRDSVYRWLRRNHVIDGGRGVYIHPRYGERSHGGD